MGARKKLLLVDDDPVVRKYITLAVSGMGFDIVEAADGEEAIRRARNWHPDLILLDNMLPGVLDGLQVCRRIREETHAGNPHIVFISSCSDVSDIEAGLQAGADEYLVKPVGPARIKQLLSTLLQKTAAANDCEPPTDDFPRRTNDASLAVHEPKRKTEAVAPPDEDPAEPGLPILLVLLPAIFLGEFLIMWLLSGLPEMPWWQAGLIDAIVLVLAVFPVLYWFVIRKFGQQIATLKAAKEELRLTSAAFNTSEAIMITDHTGRIIRVNRAFERVTGYGESDVIGQTPRILKSGRHNQDFYQQMWRRLLTTGSWRGEIWDRHKNGNVYPKEISIAGVTGPGGRVTHYVSVFKEISARKKSEEELYTLAYYDPLTGLPNRRMLLGQIDMARTATGSGRQLGLLVVVGIDQFKVFNSTLGPELGDQLLQEAKRRLQYLLPRQAVLARISGDEFAILIENIGAGEGKAGANAIAFCKDVCDAMAIPYLLDGMLMHRSSSVGGVLLTDDSAAADELLKRADIALQQSKLEGGGKMRMFDPEMQLGLQARAALEADLRQAIAKGELQLFYQLQKDDQGRSIGAEALLRWHHPQRGMVSPADFIPIAEESALILEIGQWVIQTACAQLAQWSGHPQLGQLQLSVNISAQQFKQSNFIESLEVAISQHQIDPARLKLELTESVSLDDIDHAIGKIELLQKFLGLSVSLDDFGTGYSSLSYLNRLPFDQIKIDQSFVRNFTDSASSAVMIKTIINLAHNYGCSVIAEGVETLDQFRFLRDHGCLSYQGYLFGKPMPVEEFERLILGPQDPTVEWQAPAAANAGA